MGKSCTHKNLSVKDCDVDYCGKRVRVDVLLSRLHERMEAIERANSLQAPVLTPDEQEKRQRLAAYCKGDQWEPPVTEGSSVLPGSVPPARQTDRPRLVLTKAQYAELREELRDMVFATLHESRPEPLTEHQQCCQELVESYNGIFTATDPIVDDYMGLMRKDIDIVVT